jgi:hypothetical protein
MRATFLQQPFKALLLVYLVYYVFSDLHVYNELKWQQIQGLNLNSAFKITKYRIYL